MSNSAAEGAVGGDDPGADGLGIRRAKGEAANGWLAPGTFSENVGGVSRDMEVVPITGVPTGGGDGSMIYLAW